MVSVPVNKDIGATEAKVVGPFTLRQTICLSVAAVFCWAIYTQLGSYLSMDLAGFLAMIPATLAVLLGFVKPYGLPAERFIASVFVSNVLSPVNRKYCSNGTVLQKKATKKKRYTVSKLAVK